MVRLSNSMTDKPSMNHILSKSDGVQAQARQHQESGWLTTAIATILQSRRISIWVRFREACSHLPSDASMVDRLRAE